MTPTFGDNGAFFASLQRARECCLALCLYAVTVQRIRIAPAGVVIEIDRPLPIGEVQSKEQWAAIEFYGCSVAWKVSEE